jgi:hypothetical protein
MGDIVEMGSAKHRWWKEAVVYQVRLPLAIECPLPSDIPPGLPSILSIDWLGQSARMGRYQGCHLKA